jgi:hypothetical protein
MLGLIGLLLLILFRVSSRTPTVAAYPTPEIATEVERSTPDPQVRETDDANGSAKLAA